MLRSRSPFILPNEADCVMSFRHPSVSLVRPIKDLPMVDSALLMGPRRIAGQLGGCPRAFMRDLEGVHRSITSR